MVDIRSIDKQLKTIGFVNRIISRPEVRELTNVLADDEQIDHAVNGHYKGGFALLLTTDRRVLLIDKKPLFLSMEDIRYGMISEVNLCTRLLDATVTITTIGQQLAFLSWRRNSLRELVRHIQRRVMELHMGDNIGASQSLNFRSLQTPQQFMWSSPAQPSASGANDFAISYQSMIARQHSLAHLAGHIAVLAEKSTKPIVKPLFSRPSVMTKYH